MAIKFSPGPCGCCQEYLAIFQSGTAADLSDIVAPFFVIQNNIIIGENGPISTTTRGHYSLLASSNDLLGDVSDITTIFNPGGSILPLDPSLVDTRGIFTSDIKPGPIILKNQAFEQFAGGTYWLFQLKGSDGTWTIISSQTRIAFGFPEFSVTFTINADGIISP